VLEALVQHLKDVEDEDPVINGCAEVSQTVTMALNLRQYSLTEKSP
jgi:hypothetical protein